MKKDTPPAGYISNIQEILDVFRDSKGFDTVKKERKNE